MSTIFSPVRGEGPPVILIHGFPLNQSMWDNFADLLARHHKVYTPDLPGFGQSPILPSPFSLEEVADEMIRWIEHQRMLNSVIIGHSLGGYVALAMVKKKPSLFAGLGLFHSTAEPDSEEKKESRTKAVDFIKKNGASVFTTNFIEPLFADPKNPAVAAVKEIARQASEPAVIGYTLAMRDRENRVDVLKDFDKPVLFIAGVKDKGIPVHAVERQASLCKHPKLHILPEGAHMGMFEQRAETASIIGEFIAPAP